MKTKTKAERLIYLELKWMHENPEYSLPQWYIRLVTDAEYRLCHGDPDGALHDIQQARSARLYALHDIQQARSARLYALNDIIYTDTDSYPLQEGAEK